MKTILTITIGLVVIIAGILIAAQFSKKPTSGPGLAEKAGKSLDRAAEKTADAAKEATHKAGKVLEKAGGKMQNKID